MFRGISGRVREPASQRTLVIAAGIEQTRIRRHQTKTSGGGRTGEIKIHYARRVRRRRWHWFDCSGLVAQSIKTYRHIILDGHRVKWGTPEAGTGAIVTYATVEDRGSRFPGARNCAAMVPIGPLLAASGVAGLELSTRRLRAAFALWSAVGEHPVRAGPRTPGSADILIGAQSRAARPRASPMSSTRRAGRRPSGDSSRSLICLNPEERWKTGFDGNLSSL